MSGIPPWILAVIATATAICKAVTACVSRRGRRRRARDMALQRSANEAAPIVSLGATLAVAASVMLICALLNRANDA